MKKYSLLYLFFTLTILVSAQSYRVDAPRIVSPSPNASSLAIYADYPVSHYTGIPNISVPIYDIVIDNYTIPISLNYHSSGIQVSQEASWVGLGWSLSAGGNISRTVKCSDDFNEFFSPTGIEAGWYKGPEISKMSTEYFKYYGGSTFEWGLGWTGIQLKNRLIVDSEPDIFYYSLPGYSGKFIIDKSRGVILFDKNQNVKIDIVENSTDGVSFKITSPDGVQYIYKNREITYSYSSQGALNGNSTDINRKLDDKTTNYSEYPSTYVSSWYLSKIITNNKREIDFIYESENYTSPTQESCMKYSTINFFTSGGSLHPEVVRQSSPYSNRSKQNHESLRLSKISWDNGYVTFTSSDREDMIGESRTKSPLKLDRIDIYNKNSEYIRGFQFEYSYFNNNQAGDYKYVFKRLKLTGLKELNKEQVNINKGYTFNYFEGELPAKNSKDTDYWGYSNGKKYGADYYVGVYYSGQIFPGVDKPSNLNYLKIGTLSKINYPTGGYAQFSYELNTFDNNSFDINIPKIPDIKDKYVNIPVYNNYRMNAHDYPPHDIYRFEVPGTTTIIIRCTLENEYSPFKDPDYAYYHYNDNPLGQFRKIEPTKKTYITYECPYVFNTGLPFNYPISQRGEGGEIELITKEYTLDKGVYEFEAYTPPKDVVAYWQLEYKATVNNPGTTPGSPSRTYEGGGIRISEIKTDAKTRKFKYPIGKLIVEPYLSYTTRFTHNDLSYGTYHWADYLVQLSESTRSLFTFGNGNSVGYDYVEESVTDGTNTSMTRYEFHNEREEPFGDDYGEIVSMPNYIDYQNGKLQKTKFYSNGELIKEIENLYSIGYSNTVGAFVYNAARNTNHSYSYKAMWLQNGGERVWTKGMNSTGQTVNNSQNKYNSYYQLKEHWTSSHGMSYADKIRYTTDYNDNISRKMVDKHMISVPIEKFIDRDDHVIKGEKTLYKDTLGMILPSVISTFKSKEPVSIGNQSPYYTPDWYFDTYNSYGKVLQLRDHSLSTVYIWSYNGEYPIAEIKNTTYSIVRDILGGEAYVNSLSKYGGKKEKRKSAEL